MELNVNDKPAYKKCPPAFQFYATDTLANINFRSMSLAERGCYMTLLCECWVNDSLPADEVKLAKILGLGISDINKSLTESVLIFFEISNGKITSPDLLTYRAKLDETRRKQSIGGKKGQSIKKSKLPLCEGLPEGLPEGSREEQSRKEQSRKEQSIYIRETDREWVEDYDR